MYKKQVGKRLEFIRREMEMTKEEFAREIGMTGQQLGCIERGKNALTFERLKKVCEITHLSADYILFGKEDDILDNTKGVLSKLSNEQIQSACEILQKLAIFIKNDVS